MKKIVIGVCSLFLFGCEIEKIHFQKNCCATETIITADMQKISDIILDYSKKELALVDERDLKKTKLICELYEKNKEKLYKELAQITNFYRSDEKKKESENRRKNLKNSLKKLKLDYKHVLTLVKNMEKICAQIKQQSEKLYAPYCEKRKEILKLINAKKNDAKKDYTDMDQFWKDLEIRWLMSCPINNNYDKFSAYIYFMNQLTEFINDGSLTDSFLAQHPSPLKPDEERTFLWSSIGSMISSLVQRESEDGLSMFDIVKNAAQNTSIDKKELQSVVNSVTDYMSSLVSQLSVIQQDVAYLVDLMSHWDQCLESKFENFDSGRRSCIIVLAQKYPKIEDFEKEVDKIAIRLAYQLYYQINIARFLYKEWREIYFSKMDEFFRNSVILADKLQKMCKDSDIKDEHEKYVENMRQIAAIREIVAMGTQKIFPAKIYHADSMEKTKASCKARLMKIRETYLRNINKKIS
jgi:hypothetical protein